MKSEIKIMLPIYKILYPVLFVILLAFVRGVAETREIGGILDTMTAVLAIVFMSDTYLIEIKEQRWEIFELYCLQRKKNMIYKRFLIQSGYLFFVSGIGYAFFFIQKPARQLWRAEFNLYIEFLFAVGISIAFFGVLSSIIANLFQNVWCGIGITLAIWLFLNSIMGDRIFGDFNIFAYAFKNSASNENHKWIMGKVIAIAGILAMLVLLPKTIERRGK